MVDRIIAKVEKIAICFSLLFPFAIPAADAQNAHPDVYTSTFISDFGGHAYNNVVDIYTDDAGFVWLSMFGGGVARYDGSDFRNFRTDTHVPLRNNFVTGVAQDRHNRLWVSSVGGLDVLDMRTFTLAHEVDEIVKANDHLYCAPPVCTDDGAIWFSSSNYIHRVSFRQDGSVMSRDSVRYSNQSLNLYLAAVDDDSSVWTSLDGYVTKVKYVEGKGFQLSDVNRFLYLGDDNDVTSFKRNGNVVWIGTSNGLFAFDQSDGGLMQFGSDVLLSPEITSLEVTSDGKIAIGTLAGLNVYDVENDRFAAYDASVNEYGGKVLASSQIRALKRVGDDLWAGTDRDGISILRNKRLAITNISHRENDLTSLPDAAIRAIFVDSKDRRWIGTAENGFFIQDGTPSYRGFNSRTTSLIHNTVKSFAEDAAGRIWVGTIGGEIYYMNPDNPSGIVPVPVSGPRENLDDVNDLFYDSVNDYMWIATRSGLYYYDMKSRALNKCQEDIRLCSKLVMTQDGNLWVTHISGVVSINLRSRELKNIQLPYYPFSVAFDSRSRVWIGSFDSGLYVYDQSFSELAHYTVEDGLSDDRVRALAIEGNSLWVATDHGLSRVSLSDSEILSFSTYDGIEPYSFCDNAVAVNPNTGRIVLGHQRGLSVLWPGELPAVSKRKVNLLFTECRAGNNSINLPYFDRIDLKQRDRRFTFSFADLSYPDPASVNYYIRLYPFEKEWRKVDGHYKNTRYATLPGGDFKLQIKAEDLSGNLLGEAEKILHVKPYFHRTVLFYVLLILFLALCWWQLDRLSRYNMKKREARLQEEVDKQTKLLSEQKLELEKRAEELAEQNKILLKQNEALAGHHIVASTEAAAGGTTLRDTKFVDKVMDTIRGLYKDPDLDVSTLCEAIGMSRSVLNNKIQEAFGQSIAQFIRTYRLNVAKEILVNSSHGSINISEVAYEIGFSDPKYFTRCFSKEFGVSPSSVLSGGE